MVMTPMIVTTKTVIIKENRRRGVDFFHKDESSRICGGRHDDGNHRHDDFLPHFDTFRGQKFFKSTPIA